MPGTESANRTGPVKGGERDAGGGAPVGRADCARGGLPRPQPKDCADTQRAAGTPARPPTRYHSPLRPASGHAQRGLGKGNTQGETPGWSGRSLGKPDLAPG